MTSFLLRRLVSSILLLWVVLTATFFLFHVAPGEPLRLFADPRISPEQRERLRALYGLDQPLLTQYASWLRSVTFEWEWGTSYATGLPATEVLGRALPNTFLLAAGTLLVLYGVGTPLGVLAAARAGSAVDRLVRFLALLLFAVPSFYLALFAIELLAVRWPLFPANQMTSTGAERLPPLGRALDVGHHLVLPAATLGLALAGSVVRFVRNGLLDVLEQDYVRTARAKGLSPARVLWVHALPNALAPVVQSFGVLLPALLNGALLIEVIFGWPGLGRVTFEAILARDYPVILASTALSGVLVIAGSLLADLLHALIDPRVRDV